MKIAILDIETTGFSPQMDCIIEIGVVELCLETGERRVLFDEIIKEDRYTENHRNSWIFSNSDLSHEQVMNANALNSEALQKIFDEYLVTAYNKRFDFNFLKHRGFTLKELPCPMEIATSICRIPTQWGRGYKWPKVTEAYKILIGDDNYIEKHRGASDAFDEAQIVYELYRRGHYLV